jgi:TolA-binding protein|tara:strand:- start:381 stop:1232 length:852 start_codon:yes stop_codon:yes gene_type:complete
MKRVFSPRRLKASWKSCIFFFLLFFLACAEDRSDKLIKEADEEWIKGNNHGAIEILKKVLVERPKGPPAEEALFRLGEITYYSIGNSSQAIIYFKELLKVNKNKKFSYTAQKYISEIVEFSLKDYDQSIIEYQKLIDNFNVVEENGDHQFRIASIYYKKQEYDQSLVEFQILIEKYQDSPRVEESLFKMSEILYALNRCPEALEKYKVFAKQFPDSSFLSEMDFVMASCKEEDGRLKEAHLAFKSLVGRYPYTSILNMKLEGIETRLKKSGNVYKNLTRSKKR